MTSSLPARRLIPRWRPTRCSLRLSEAASTNNSPSTGPVRDSRDELDRSIAAWRETGAPGVLGDVLSFAVDPELVPLVREVGHEALRIGAATTPLQLRLIGELGARESTNKEGELAPPRGDPPGSPVPGSDPPFARAPEIRARQLFSAARLCSAAGRGWQEWCCRASLADRAESCAVEQASVANNYAIPCSRESRR